MELSQCKGILQSLTTFNVQFPKMLFSNMYRLTANLLSLSDELNWHNYGSTGFAFSKSGRSCICNFLEMYRISGSIQISGHFSLSGYDNVTLLESVDFCCTLDSNQDITSSNTQLVTPLMQQSGCPSQTSKLTVLKLLSAHSDGVVDSIVNVSYGPYVTIRYSALSGPAVPAE